MNILITGGNGYIAQSISSFFKEKYNIVSLTRGDFNLLDSRATDKWFEDKLFDVVIHTAITGGNRLLQESSCVLDDNLNMYYNLIRNKNKFKKFINFGSGAEIFAKNTYYGASKHIIAKSLNDKKNFYNLRIFAVFDENENDRRFIKSCIKNYINKQPIVIHQNKKMDFFYMGDLLQVIELYLEDKNNVLPQTFDCVYQESISLRDIANIVNSLDTYRVDIVENNKNEGESYSGTYTFLFENYYGLKKGIKNTYEKIKAMQQT